MNHTSPAERHAIELLGRVADRLPAQAYGRNFIQTLLRQLRAGTLSPLTRTAQDMLWDCCHRYRRQLSHSPLLVERAERWSGRDDKNGFWQGFLLAQARMKNAAWPRVGEIAAALVAEGAPAERAYLDGIDTARLIAHRRAHAGQGQAARFQRQREQNLRAVAAAAGQVC